MQPEQQLDYAAVRAAADRIAGAVRPVAVAPAAQGVWYALEHLQHTGSFKARGARNFLAAHREAGTLRRPASPSPPAATRASPAPGRPARSPCPRPCSCPWAPPG